MRAPFNCSALQTIAPRGGEEDCWLYHSVLHRNTALETAEFCHSLAEAGAYTTGKPGFQSALFFLWMMGQQEVWLPEEIFELSSMKIAPLFCLYGSGAGHHIISSCRAFGAALLQALVSALMPAYPEVKQSCPKPQTELNRFLCSWKCKEKPKGALGFFSSFQSTREASVRGMSSPWRRGGAGSAQLCTHRQLQGIKCPRCKARRCRGQASCCLPGGTASAGALGHGRGSWDV